MGKSISGRSVLIVLDGFGIGKETPFNAIANARMPFFRTLLSHYPHSKLLTHGGAVGLPDGVMGNSEVGHMTLGAGRVIYQDLTRISNSIRDGSFAQNPTLLETIHSGAKAGGRLHLLGLLSDGGVHSHIEHFLAVLDICASQNIPSVYLHLITDGRDTSPKSGLDFVARLNSHPWVVSGNARIASVSGRFFAMDRDQRWERVEVYYNTITGEAASLDQESQPRGTPTSDKSPCEQVMEVSYSSGKTDEFIQPKLLLREGAIRDKDAVLFLNYRSDRAREISLALGDPAFSAFRRKRKVTLSCFSGMTVYDKTFTFMKVIFPPQTQENIFGQCLENLGLKQFRIAETEKYAHITFFFNGGREPPFRGEDRLLIPSPREVATYDLKPEMSALKIATAAATRIAAQSEDFVLMNFANADMVGHTGNYDAAVTAAETLDQCIAQVVGTATGNGYHVLLTADHGNAEEMQDCDGEIHTQHTLNPVPMLWVSPNSFVAPRSNRRALNDGTLADVMPTLCELMGIAIPEEVDGKSLLPKDWRVSTC